MVPDQTIPEMVFFLFIPTLLKKQWGYYDPDSLTKNSRIWICLFEARFNVPASNIPVMLNKKEERKKKGIDEKKAPAPELASSEDITQ